MEELLQAIKEKSVTLDTIRHAPHPLCKSPPAHISVKMLVSGFSLTFSSPKSLLRFLETFSYIWIDVNVKYSCTIIVGLQCCSCDNVNLDLIMITSTEIIADPAFTQHSSESEDHHVRQRSPPSHCPASPSGHPRPLGDTLRPKAPPSPAVYPDKARGPSEGPIPKRKSSLLNSLRPPLPLQAKEGLHSVNGCTKPWDSFTQEEFAHKFHESVLQCTQKALQKHKGSELPVQK